jgi:hypothetical protein
VSDLDAEADRLYALPARDFTAARDARAAELRGEDPELSAQLATLRRPTAAAAAVNAIVRADPDGVAALTEIGERLRAAQDAGDGRALAALIRERRDAVRALIAAGPAFGATVHDDVSRTLEAATVDPWAAQAVAGGRLLRALTAVGFDPVDLDGAVAAAPVTGPPTGPRPIRKPSRGRGAAAAGRRAEQLRADREAADAAIEAAEREASEAADDLAGFVEAADEADRVADDVTSEVTTLETRLGEARTRQELADRTRKAALRDRDEATATARAALRRLEEARERREALGDEAQDT